MKVDHSCPSSWSWQQELGADGGGGRTADVPGGEGKLTQWLFKGQLLKTSTFSSEYPLSVPKHLSPG